MQARGIIDRTLPERRGILSLLEKVNCKEITVREMDEIGEKLGRSGKRAVPPLVRRLWREKSGEILSRYAYLLDFVDDESWLEQLVQIALRRTDLEEEGKSALLAALDAYGIDVTAPPFASILGRMGGSLRVTLPRILEKGEQGHTVFMEDFVGYPPEVQRAVVRELPGLDDSRVVPLLEIVSGYLDLEVAGEALRALGRARFPEAALVLRRYLRHGEPSLREEARRSLRRLSFLGVDTSLPLQRLPEFREAFISPFDGNGNCSYWISRPRRDGSIDLLFLQVSDSCGLTDAFSYPALSEEEYEGMLVSQRQEEPLLEVEPAYALRLLRDALYVAQTTEGEIPPEYYVRRSMFTDVDMSPSAYYPDFTPFDFRGLATSPVLLEKSQFLLGEDYFADWFLALPRVYDYAEEWNRLGGSDGGTGVREVRDLVRRFCDELIVPDLQRIVRRLFLTADIIRMTGGDAETLETTVATAMSLSCGGIAPHAHPFLRRLALESMDVAAEAMAEGYDLRKEPFADEL